MGAGKIGMKKGRPSGVNWIGVCELGIILMCCEFWDCTGSVESGEGVLPVR
jgi:hypothetical protein